MALVLADRVKETTTTTGTGTVTLLGASTGFQSFAVIGNANTTYYTITAQTGTEWEVGIGTYTSAGTLLARTTVLSSSNGGSAVNFSAGTKDVFVTYPSSRSVYADGAILTATNSSVLPTTSGGTGLTSFTANGVVYASSTSALATGSALVFDGSNLSTTGQVLLENNKYIGFKNTTGTYAASIFNDTSNFLNFYNSGNTGTIFYVNAAEQMRLTSTGLGIGTTSPAQSLHVKTSTSATPITLGVLSNATGLPALSFNGAYASTTMAGIYGNGATASSLYYEVPSGQSHFFGIADVTKMTLDSAGNLGLGVTPSAWRTASSERTLQLNSGSLWSFSNFGLGLLNNAFYDSTGAYKYINSNYALHYFLSSSNGSHAWFVAASGTAGDTISFTQAMTLDASGNLMVGGTTALNTSSGRGNITIDGTSNSILNFGVGGVAKSYLFQNAGNFIITNLASAGGSVIFENNGSERMRIDSSGNVGIGTSSPGGKLDVRANASSGVYGAIIYNTSATGQGLTVRAGSTSSQDAFNCQTYDGNTSLFTVQGGGNVGIGTSSPSAKLDVEATSDVGFALSNSSSVTSGNRGNIYMLNSSNSTVGLIRFGAVTDNVGTEIQFHTRPAAGGLTEFLRIASTGAFGLSGANYGSSGQVLTSGGASAAPTWASPAVGGFSAMTVITTSSNFTIPTGKTTLKVTVVGAGGGGGFGTAAAAGNGGNTTLASGTQSISTITGGYGSGGPTGSYYGGIGGVGSGGDLNFYGSDGHGSNNNTTGFSGNGGNSFLGGGGSSRGLVSSGNAEPGRIYGGGGGATYGGNGGGGGGTAIKYLTGMTPGNTLAITIGAGGAIGAGGSGNGGLGADGVVIIEY